MSVLALVETALATSLMVWLTVHFGTMKFIAWSACVAPLLLLKTDQSCRLGLALFNRFLHSPLTGSIVRLSSVIVRGAGGRIADLLMLPVMSLTFIPGLLVARIGATVLTATVRPLLSASSIPNNWLRLCLSIDSSIQPTLMPAPSGTNPKKITTLGSLRDFARNNERFRQVFRALIPGFLPALVYRWYLKATCLVYAPLLWLAWSAQNTYTSLDERLSGLWDSELGRFVRAYSIAVSLLFIVKIALLTFTAEFVQWWDRSELTRFAAIYAVPAEIPIWQAASALNAALALALFMVAKRVPGLVNFPRATTAGLVTMKVIRTTLTLYTVACT